MRTERESLQNEKDKTRWDNNHKLDAWKWWSRIWSLLTMKTFPEQLSVRSTNDLTWPFCFEHHAPAYNQNQSSFICHAINFKQEEGPSPIYSLLTAPCSLPSSLPSASAPTLGGVEYRIFSSLHLCTTEASCGWDASEGTQSCTDYSLCLSARLCGNGAVEEIQTLQIQTTSVEITECMTSRGFIFLSLNHSTILSTWLFVHTTPPAASIQSNTCM